MTRNRKGSIETVALATHASSAVGQVKASAFACEGISIVVANDAGGHP